MPLSEIIDRYSILTLKKERLVHQLTPNDKKVIDNQLEIMDFEIDSYFGVKKQVINSFKNILKEINGSIWTLESDIREGKEGKLGIEEVGQRALKIRDLNKIRVFVKNEILKLFNEKEFVEFKGDHASS